LLGPLVIAFQSLVAGETCPAPIDVEARVRSILHLSAEQELSEGFVVERHEAGLYVELRQADTTLIGQRTLPAEGSCDELAQAAAVVLSAWLSNVHPDFAGALPPAPAPAPVAEPVPEPEPTAAPPPATPPRVPVAAPAPAAPPPPSPPRHFDLALGAGADLVSSGSFALAGVLVAGYLPPRGIGLSGFAAVSWPRQERLGPGTVDWRRWPVGVGPSLRVATSGIAWDVSVGPALGWLHFSGSKFQRSSSQDGFEWGGFLDLRVASRGRHSGVFGLGNVQLFPGNYGASANGLGGPWFARVPSFSFVLAAGAWLSP